MSLIYGGDDIAKAIRQDDETAMAGFRSAYTAHMDRLRAELADVRKSVADAERLTYRYAALIGEQRETMRIAATPSGIAAAIRRLDAGQCSADVLLPMVTALAGISKQHQGLDGVTESLDDAALRLMDLMGGAAADSPATDAMGHMMGKAEWPEFLRGSPA
jgi:hypothetical protein